MCKTSDPLQFATVLSILNNKTINLLEAPSRLPNNTMCVSRKIRILLPSLTSSTIFPLSGSASSALITHSFYVIKWVGLINVLRNSHVLCGNIYIPLSYWLQTSTTKVFVMQQLFPLFAFAWRQRKAHWNSYWLQTSAIRLFRHTISLLTPMTVLYTVSWETPHSYVHQIYGMCVLRNQTDPIWKIRKILLYHTTTSFNKNSSTSCIQMPTPDRWDYGFDYDRHAYIYAPEWTEPKTRHALPLLLISIRTE